MLKLAVPCQCVTDISDSTYIHPCKHTCCVNHCSVNTESSAGFCEKPCNLFIGTELQSYMYKNKHIRTLGKYSPINIIKTQNRTYMCRLLKCLTSQSTNGCLQCKEKGEKRSPPKIKQIFNLAHSNFQRLMVMIL